MANNIQPTGLDWKNLPDKTTPISAENLNKMANTIDDLVTAVNPLNTVEANPVGTPTEGLEKVEIDGTLYEVKGGHKILNDSGTTLTQKDNLQFKGVYTQNNGDNTEVDISRTMTKAQMEALSGESLKGFINTSDEPDSLPLTAEWVAYDSNTSVKDKIDAIDGKTISSFLFPANTVVRAFGSFTVTNDLALPHFFVPLQNALLYDITFSQMEQVGTPRTTSLSTEQWIIAPSNNGFYFYSTNGDVRYWLTDGGQNDMNTSVFGFTFTISPRS